MKIQLILIAVLFAVALNAQSKSELKAEIEKWKARLDVEMRVSAKLETKYKETLATNKIITRERDAVIRELDEINTKVTKVQAYHKSLIPFTADSQSISNNKDYIIHGDILNAFFEAHYINSLNAVIYEGNLIGKTLPENEYYIVTGKQLNGYNYALKNYNPCVYDLQEMKDIVNASVNVINQSGELIDFLNTYAKVPSVYMTEFNRQIKLYNAYFDIMEGLKRKAAN